MPAFLDRFRSRTRPARVPENTRVYAVGDVHGRSDLLARLHRRIADDLDGYAGRGVLIHLGDYIDRGPDSQGVVDMLLGPMPGGAETVNLKGNHEDFLLRFVDDDEDDPSTWLYNGGLNCLESYGIDMADPSDSTLRERLLAALPPAHLEFFRRLVPWHREGDYFFAHAGVDPKQPLDAQTEQSLLWIRDRFLASHRDFGATVVHGHSIAPEPQVMRNRIGIDTGAYYSGRLTCLVLESAERRFIDTADTA